MLVLVCKAGQKTRSSLARLARGVVAGSAQLGLARYDNEPTRASSRTVREPDEL